MALLRWGTLCNYFFYHCWLIYIPVFTPTMTNVTEIGAFY